MGVYVCVGVCVGVRPLFATAGASCLTHSSLLEVESSQALSGEWKDFVLPKKICPSFPIPSLKILLRNGVLLTFTVAKHSGDIERVTVDRSLVNRLPSSIQSGTR